MPKVSIITPSFNKTHYVGDAIESVMKQTLKDFEYYIIENSTDRETRFKVKEIIESYNDSRIHYIEEDFTEEERKERYPTATILNKYYDIMQGDYYFYLSDDDTLVENCLEVQAHILDVRQDVHVVYHTQQGKVGAYGMDWIDDGVKKADRVINVGENVDCLLDGGQVMFRRQCLASLEKPYYTDSYVENAVSHCDGLFLQKLANKWNFFPINETLSIHRRTPLSTFDNHDR